MGMAVRIRDILGQLLVINTDGFPRSFELRRPSIQNKPPARDQLGGPILKPRNSYLGALEIAKDADRTAQVGSTLSDGIYPSLMICQGAMGKINADQINPSPNQIFN